MSRPLWFVNLLKKIYPSRFFVARATQEVPAIGRLIDHMLFNGDELLFLPQDRAIQINRTIERPEEMVLPSEVVKHFIEESSYRWIMDFCLCRASENCEDYPIDLGCLFLGEATQGINPELGRHVSKEEALAHIERSQELGLVHFVGRNRLDTVWLGVNPGDKLMTICSCCPCCCLWRVLPHVTPRISTKIKRMPGVTVRVTKRCVGCGQCVQENVCFMEAIQIRDGRAVISELCKGCGRCVNVCPHEAIELSIEDEGFIDQSIARISSVVDVS